MLYLKIFEHLLCLFYHHLNLCWFLVYLDAYRFIVLLNIFSLNTCIDNNDPNRLADSVSERGLVNWRSGENFAYLYRIANRSFKWRILLIDRTKNFWELDGPIEFILRVEHMIEKVFNHFSIDAYCIRCSCSKNETEVACLLGCWLVSFASSSQPFFRFVLIIVCVGLFLFFFIWIFVLIVDHCKPFLNRSKVWLIEDWS